LDGDDEADADQGVDLLPGYNVNIDGVRRLTETARALQAAPARDQTLTKTYRETICDVNLCGRRFRC
jgi:hypothetical protein